MGVAAPVIVAEMAEWTALGGGNSGIVGDANHSYGFHLAANEVSASDYSRWRDPQGSDGPYADWNWACAGDFRHGGDERLRAMHARVLARLMAGELPMICEFIGQPYPDQPVLYWARWNGIKVLKKYTGAGHGVWSHISWFRSRADEPAGLWREDGGVMELAEFPKYGDRGDAVQYVQYALYYLGYDPAVIDKKTKQPIESTRFDKIYGDALQEQVRRYRADHGVENAKGDKVTPWTLERINSERGAAKPSADAIAAAVRAELAKLTATTTLALGE